MTDQWIVVPNWERFQHYKDRDPPWIKLHRSLASDPDWLNLTGHRRGLLISVWLEYASTHGRVRFDARSLSRRINLRVNTFDLECLVHAGFLEVSASKPLAKPGRVVSLEAEGERETPKPPSRGKGNGEVAPGATGTRSRPRYSPATCPHCGLGFPGPNTLADHVQNVHYDVATEGGGSHAAGTGPRT